MTTHKTARLTVILCGWLVAAPTLAAPSVTDALNLKPVQDFVEYDHPPAADVEKCTIKAEKVGKTTAWVVRDPNHTTLRQFADTNGDNIVDTWSYFHNGVEVYRDIDADFNGKADQYRWFHTAGTRWAIDRDEDNTIDAWRFISAEETAGEAVEAVCQGDTRRFTRLLLNSADIAKLGLAKVQADQLAARVKRAVESFDKLKSNEELGRDAEFSDFGGIKPGIVPAGTNGSTKDLLVYENVWAMVKTGGEHRQVQLGTMIRVEGAWKLVDGPALAGSEQVGTGFFFNPEGAGEAALVQSDDPPTEQMQELLAEMEKIDGEIMNATEDQQAEMNSKRADLLEKLAEVAPSQPEREQWLRQLADMASAAAQGGTYAAGVERLRKLEADLAAQGGSEDLQTYVLFRRIHAEYGLALSKPDVDYAKLQAEWVKQLESFVEQYATSEHVTEALLQLAMASEWSGDSEAALKWYGRIVKDFPDSLQAPKAKGAVVRLSSEGRPIRLRGKDVRGEVFDLSQQTGKAVIIQFWSTTCQVCKSDHATLKDLYAKNGGRGLEIVSINLDYSRDAMIEYLKANRLAWKHLYEPGGFDSRLANELGVVTLPLMLLVDPNNRVVSHNIQAAELETELKKLLTPRAQAAAATNREASNR